jgi:hypothetical protein
MKESDEMGTKIVLGILGLLVIGVVAMVLPDLRRYLKMSSM